ncbi:unnamed protein product [Aphanomyces euteiches]
MHPSPSTHAIDEHEGTLIRVKWFSRASKLISYFSTLVSYLAAILVAVDIVGNNWELNDFAGDAKHFFTPLLEVNSQQDLEATYAFPLDASPSAVSNTGRFMIESAISQVHSVGTHYFLTLSSFPIVHAANDICGRLVDSYPVDVTQQSAVYLGHVQDQVTFIRGNTLSHVFGDSIVRTKAELDANSSTLVELGYEPGRVGLDMRLTTAIPIPPPRQSVRLNVTMYRFYGKAFCTGCNAGTELGMDTCSIVYSYNDTTKTLNVSSSSAIHGQSHAVGFVFLRRLGPVISLFLRGFCVVMACAGYGAARKTVKWTDSSTLTSWFKKQMHKFAPPLHRQPSHAFDFSYFCFNSDVFVILYSIAVFIDEDVAMVYARVLTTWYKPAPFDLWTELRLRALAFRWLWFNLLLVKFMKWICHFLSTARYNGSNFVMGWLNFSTVTSVYMTVFALFERTDYIEYGNSVRVYVTSVNEDLDSIYVEFENSWYMRGLWSLVFLMVGNLIGVLIVDHVINRRWWRLVAKNSLGRQHMFNSTSILSDMNVPYEDWSFHSIVLVRTRELCTIQWFITSHISCFGLPEEPSLIRKVTSSKMAAAGIRSTGMGQSPSKTSLGTTPSSASNSQKVVAKPSPPRMSMGRSADLRPTTSGRAADNRNSTGRAADMSYPRTSIGRAADLEASRTSLVNGEGNHSRSSLGRAADNNHSRSSLGRAADVVPSSHACSEMDGVGDVIESYLIAQDQDGCLHMCDCEKREVLAIGLEGKIMRDAFVRIGAKDSHLPRHTLEFTLSCELIMWNRVRERVNDNSLAPTSPSKPRKPSSWDSMAHSALKYITKTINAFAIFLVVVDILGNNWELHDFTGDAKHFRVPLLSTKSRSQLESGYVFPTLASPSSVSNVGRFMIDNTIEQVHCDNGTFYAITMNSFPIIHPDNDICGRLVNVYPVNTVDGGKIRLGTVEDQITFVRGNTLSHLFGDTDSVPPAPPGTNASVLTDMGYLPARAGLDMRLTTAIPVPRPGQKLPFNVTMYRFYSKAFCSACHPGTELGMDTCSIVYSYNDTTKAVTVHSSSAIYGQSHVLGFIFLRRWGVRISLVLRAFCLFLAFSAYGAARKTVRWVDMATLSTWAKNLAHMIVPPMYSHNSKAFSVIYFCFNSDVFVILYSIAVLIDEDVSMVYARVVTTWYKPAPFELWTELRLRALSFRWLWFNLFLVKLMKWACHFVSTAQHNGSNFVMGLFNFSSVPWIYMTVFALFERTDYIEYGNSVRVDVTSVTENLNSIYVEFMNSWYMRGLTSLVILMVGNLLAVLLVDHFVNRKWWRLIARNSLGRQHMFNSTSILSDTGLPLEDKTLHSMTMIKARALCSLHWFFTSHVVCFGLPEDRSLVRKLTKSSTNGGAKPATGSPMPHSPSRDLVEAIRPLTGGTPENKTIDADVHTLRQNDDGELFLFDSDNREVQALGIEVKILRDASYIIG